MLSVEQCLTAIRTHTLGLADAAEGHLDSRIEHCPGWTMADLVWHLTAVQWFWNHIASERPSEEPQGLSRPERPANDHLIDRLLAGLDALVHTLGVADQDAACWTWGLEENVRFITRHQVQEAAVHHWDALNAAGSGTWTMDPVVAMDAVDDFLTHSVANARWPVPDSPRLGGTLWFCACVGDSFECDSWWVTDGDVPGTIAHQTFPIGVRGPDLVGKAAGTHGSAEDMLLWLYRRIPVPGIVPFDGDLGIVERFRDFTFTD